ncbi:flagellar biosynthesis protein FlhF [Aminithiophilus ramosus]|uniref:Flagellar biosynthesis protein FlhF n=3 Tax=Synergistia TaxID=649775 RepID=A0A9Q7AR26_9BACT|nr:flagellar biosynthesis protein FlhF [Aminithiophilus ramosus]QVL37659.1 flagellar biosynthesis protein FlhF [Synergistota bacterium]
MRLVQQITFDAKDDAEAMRLARTRLGDDAVVISVVPVKRGGFLGLFRKRMLAVTAGIFEEDRQEREREKRERILAFQKLLEIRQAVQPPVPAPVPRQKGETVGERLSPPPEIVSEGEVSLELSSQALELSRAVRLKTPVPEGERELLGRVETLQETLHKVLARLEEGVAAPRDALTLSLVSCGVEPPVASRLVERYRQVPGGGSFRGWLAGEIACRGKSWAEALKGPRALFIGPTGVGKTTTIAKIGAAFALWENRKVLLLTSDTYRIAAVEQLRTYAKILGVPMEVVYEPSDLAPILARYADVDVVLLDTAGRSQNDEDKVAEYRDLYEAFKPQSVHLVLAANVKYGDVLDVMNRMNVVPIDGVVATKLDETRSAGSLLNVVFDFDLPLSFLTAGQNVPNDIAVASGESYLSYLFPEGREICG